jgi:hypothetical protein
MSTTAVAAHQNAVFPAAGSAGGAATRLVVTARVADRVVGAGVVAEGCANPDSDGVVVAAMEVRAEGAPRGLDGVVAAVAGAGGAAKVTGIRASWLRSSPRV